MAITVLHNTIADTHHQKMVHDAVMLAGIRAPADWKVFISEFHHSPAWTIRIVIPDGRTWVGDFFGPDQQSRQYIRETIAGVLSALAETSES
jgi:hypothetical protein